MEVLPAVPAADDGDVAALVLSRLMAHDDAGTAFVDAATGKTLSFSALRRAALSLASALRLGLGLRRGDAVLVLARNSLLLPQILLGVLAAGAAVATTDAGAGADAATVTAAARASGAVMLVADPDVAARLAPGAAVLPPLLLTTPSSQDPAALSAEELIHGGGDPAFAEAAAAAAAGSGSDVAFLAYPSATRMTRGDLAAAVAEIGGGGGGRRVCVASLVPMCSALGLPLLALGLPAAGATTVLLLSDPDPTAAREAVAAHAATDLVAATPEAAAAALLAPPPPLDGKLSTLRRVMVATTPLTAGARQEFRRRLPWVQMMSLSGTPENPTPTELLSLSLTTPAAPVEMIQHSSLPADPVPATNEGEAASLVPPTKKINMMISGDIFSRSTMRKILRKRPVAGNRQAASKL